MKGILLGVDNDLVAENGSLKFGNTTVQEVDGLLVLNQGEIKDDPILGPNLVEMIRTTTSRIALQKQLRQHLTRDNKDFDQVSNYLQIAIR